MPAINEPLSLQEPTTMQLVRQRVPPPPSSPQQQQQHYHQQMHEARGYQKQPKHLPILTIKNLFDIQSESSSASATSLLHSDHSLQSTSTPFNRSNTSSISTYDNNHHHSHHNHRHKGLKKLDCGLTVANLMRDDETSIFENSPVDGKVVLEVYEQIKKPCLATREPHSSPLSSINFNFEFDNWSLDELPPMDDGKFSDRIQLESTNDLRPEMLLLLPMQSDIEQDYFSGDAINQSLELNSMIESMKELTLLDRFKGMFRKNSTNMLKRLNSSSFDLLLFKNGENGIMDGSTRIVSSSPSPNKIKFEEFVASESDEKDQGQAHTMPSASTCTPTPITPNNYHPTQNPIHRHHHHHQKHSRSKLSSSTPKRRKSFLHLRSASLPFNLFDFKLNSTSTTKTSSPFLNSPKLILKCKVNQNYNQESIESIKQDLIQFDEFWRKFELMEQAKNNYSNDELLNSMRLEQVRNYYYGN